MRGEVFFFGRGCEGANRYALAGRTLCVKERSSYLVAAILRRFHAQAQFAGWIVAEQRQSRHQVAEFLHCFTILARKITIHALNGSNCASVLEYLPPIFRLSRRLLLVDFSIASRWPSMQDLREARIVADDFPAGVGGEREFPRLVFRPFCERGFDRLKKICWGVRRLRESRSRPRNAPRFSRGSS